MDQDELKKQKKSLMNLYGLFGASIVLSVIPHYGAAGLSLIFFIALLLMASHMRKNAQDNSLVDNHATYVVRTIWISAFISLITMIIAAIYVHGAIDPEPFIPCAQKILAHAQELAENSDIAYLVSLTEPCMAPFLGVNAKPLMIGGSIAICPLMLYIAYRFFYGFQRAFKGYRLADPKRWF